MKRFRILRQYPLDLTIDQPATTPCALTLYGGFTFRNNGKLRFGFQGGDEFRPKHPVPLGDKERSADKIYLFDSALGFIERAISAWSFQTNRDGDGLPPIEHVGSSAYAQVFTFGRRIFMIVCCSFFDPNLITGTHQGTDNIYGSRTVPWSHFQPVLFELCATDIGTTEWRLIPGGWSNTPTQSLSDTWSFYPATADELSGDFQGIVGCKSAIVEQDDDNEWYVKLWFEVRRGSGQSQILSRWNLSRDERSTFDGSTWIKHVDGRFPPVTDSPNVWAGNLFEHIATHVTHTGVEGMPKYVLWSAIPECALGDDLTRLGAPRAIDGTDGGEYSDVHYFWNEARVPCLLFSRRKSQVECPGDTFGAIRPWIAEGEWFDDGLPEPGPVVPPVTPPIDPPPPTPRITPLYPYTAAQTIFAGYKADLTVANGYQEGDTYYEQGNQFCVMQGAQTPLFGVWRKIGTVPAAGTAPPVTPPVTPPATGAVYDVEHQSGLDLTALTVPPYAHGDRVLVFGITWTVRRASDPNGTTANGDQWLVKAVL